MIDGLLPYPEYNEPGPPWLGEIPAYWEVRRNGRLFAQRNETGYPDLPILEVSLRTGVRVRDFDNTARKQIMSDMQKYKRARAGDIAYNMMRMWQGAVGVAPVDGLVSPAYVVAKPFPETCSRYFEYLFRTPAYMNEVNKFSRGIVSDRNRLYWEDFKQIPSPFPPPEEQAAIVRFLDYIDRRVKRYIRAKRKLIALLNEQKQAIIRRAVTRGLEPNVPLKPSGVAWLGDVPEHWEVSRIRACLKDTKAGIWGDDPTPDNIADQVICLRVADFDMSRFGVSPARLTMRAVPESARTPRLLVPGDILMEKSGGGEAEPVGRVVLFRGESAPHAISSNFIVRLRPDPSIVKPEFLLNVLAMMQATRRNVAWIKQTTGIQNLDERAYLSLSIGIPPLEEQEQIVRHIDHTTGSTNNALSRIVMEIDLIHEYRTRIIADAVTGKLDVREAAAALPDDADAVESEAEELLDDDAANDDVELDTEPEEAEV